MAKARGKTPVELTQLRAEHELLLQNLDEAYERTAWHGPNLHNSLRRVSAEQAAWRQAADRHNIWEIALHAAYWKYVVRRRLTGEKRGSFELKGSNWFERPRNGDLSEWPRDLALLDSTHRALREVVVQLDPAQLHTTVGRGKVDHAKLIRGIAFHDVYHAGQIQTLKRLSRLA